MASMMFLIPDFCMCIHSKAKCLDGALQSELRNYQQISFVGQIKHSNISLLNNKIRGNI